jgi:hypothetical protein
MVFHGSDALTGLGLYAAACTLAVAGGVGLLKILRLRVDGKLGLALAPVLTLTFWALILGLTGSARLPVRLVVPWVWGGTLVLAAYGCYRFRPLLPALPLLALCACLPVAGMAKAFAFGLTEYTPTLSSDGWAYAALSEYQWEFGRKPLAERSHFHDTGFLHTKSRYISSSLLGLLSCLYRRGETIYVGALLQAFALFCTACALLFFWLSRGTRTWVALAATAATVLCGWSLRVVWFNNFDNSVFLPFVPALVGVVGLMGPADRRFRLLCGLLLAAAVYVYIEGCLVGLPAAGLACLPRLLRERSEWRAWLATVGTALVTAALLLIPSAKMLYQFGKGQVGAVQLFVTTPGGWTLIPDLYNRPHLPVAAWSLSGTGTLTAYPVHRKLRIAVALTCLLGLGVLRLVWRRQWGLLLALALFLAGAGYMVWGLHCDYGAYKMLNVGWWCVMAVVIAGAELVVAAVRFRPLQTAVVAGGFVFAGWYAYLSQADNYLDNSPLYAHRLSDFDQTAALRAVAGNGPVIDATEDWLNNLNSRYFHRSYNPYPVLLRGIVRFGTESWRNARPVSPHTRYLITDADPTPFTRFLAGSAKLIRTAGTYKIWELDPDHRGAHVVGIDAPYGVEGNEGGPFFWMGPDPASLHVLAARPGTLVCDCYFAMGPCLPGVPTRTLQIGTDEGPHHQVVVSQNKQTLRIPVRPGINRLRLQVLDKPTLPRTSAADGRTLLLLVALYSAQLEPAERPKGSEVPEGAVSIGSGAH